jgi:four helix bundle protein
MNHKSQSLHDVLVWQKAHAFTLALYSCTNDFPTHEMYALISHLRLAATSIGSNFVEGLRKRTTPDQLRFYNIAQGSAGECLAQLVLPHGLKDAETSALPEQVEEVSRRLQGYLNGLERNAPDPARHQI